MFEIGQRVRCINRVGWNTLDDNPDKNAPRYGEIRSVTSELEPTFFGDCIGISGCDGVFLACFFVPLTEDPKAVEETMERHFNKFLKEPAREGV